MEDHSDGIQAQACSNEGVGTSREAAGAGLAAYPDLGTRCAISIFRKQAHQSLAVAASSHAREDQAFIDAVSGLDDE
jgi:hypothetical protein